MTDRKKTKTLTLRKKNVSLKEKTAKVGFSGWYLKQNLVRQDVYIVQQSPEPQDLLFSLSYITVSKST